MVNVMLFVILQAMALEHQGCIEIACNLLNWNITGPQLVKQTVAGLAQRHGIQSGDSYQISKLPEDIVSMVAAHLGYR